ncbi:MAG: hypothetical protein J6562_04545 [Candidatus Schmidhempelia sp.]|nr:hypothetical protein [Candidatus Schmidhempelia sp.]
MKRTIILLFISLFLSGCYNLKREEEKLLNEINQYYQENVPNKDKQICFYLGNISFPYQSQNLSYPEFPKFKVWVNNELNRRLNLFTQLSLLQAKSNKDLIKYTLTEKGKPYFKEGKFCFGQIKYIRLLIPISKAAQIEVKAEYQFTHIPDWVTSDIFRDYFYRHNGKLSNQNYPDFKENGTSDVSLSISRLRDDSYILDDKEQIIYNISSSYHPLKNYQSAKEAFAYYDDEIAKRLIYDLNKWKTRKVYWGDDDPILMAEPAMTDKMVKANNIILMPEKIERLITRNKIHIIKATIDGEFFSGFGQSKMQEKGEITMTLSKDGSLSNYDAVYYKGNIKLNQLWQKNIALEDDSVSWTFVKKKFSGSWPIDYPFKMRFYDEAYSSKDYDLKVIAHKSLYSDAVYYTREHSGSVSYKTDALKQIINISSEHYSYANFDVNPVYDDQQRLIRYSDKVLKYRGNNLISITDTNSKKELSYDSKNRLVSSKNYIKDKGKFILNNRCNYLFHNEYGDWTVETCGEMILNRTIIYYERE